MTTKRLLAATLAAVGLSLAATGAGAAATIVIVNGNAPGVGFNDPTPATPVGGNTGTTKGQQRLNAFAYAASIWGAELDSAVPIKILATMTPLTCTETSAVLGSAGPRFIDRDWDGVPVPGHWYHMALADKLAGSTGLLPTQQHIGANFNSNLGNPGCLTGPGFYLGLDGNEGAGIDLVAVLLHEFGHGLGFSTVTSGTSGNYTSGFPSIYDKFAYDNAIGKAWDQMTALERRTSAINGRNLVWNGANVTAAAPSVLWKGTLKLVVTDPPSVAGEYVVGDASFGPYPDFPGLNRMVMRVVDQADGTGLACTPLDAANAKAVKNRIAMVDRGVCGFAIKAKMVQDAGAVGMLVVDNVQSSPPAALGGFDPSVTIPAARLTPADGTKLKAAMVMDGRSSGVVVRFGIDRNVLSGADAQGRVNLFAPNPFQSGSSVSHFDTNALKNLLMEPNINNDLTHVVKPPYDLTLPMFKDIGW